MRRPTLNPTLPIEDRLLIVVLYRLTEDCRETGHMPGAIKAGKALNAATRIAQGLIA